jgi:PDZ domain-containing protein
MSRRSAASVVGAVLFVLTVLVATLYPTNYVIYSPGPTVNLLTKDKTGGYVVRVTGAKTYRDTGALRLLTVVPTTPNDQVFLPEAMMAWLSPDQAVYRESDIYPPAQTTDEVDAESQVDMVNSQDSAVAAALHVLGYKFRTSVQVLGVTRGGPGDGALEVHDRILAVNGQPIRSIRAVVTKVRAVTPGQKVAMKVERGTKVETIRIRTGPSKTNPKQSALQITVGRGYEFPVQVHLRISSLIGGPSAGTMFALAIYDTLTRGSLTGGGNVAGTGTIDGAGQVGGIGGIQQKLAAAQHAGAQLFLAPAENCDEVRGGPYDPHQMKAVRISALSDALGAAKAWRANHDVKLPTC